MTLAGHAIFSSTGREDREVIVFAGSRHIEETQIPPSAVGEAGFLLVFEAVQYESSMLPQYSVN